MPALEREWMLQANARQAQRDAVEKLQEAFPKHSDYIEYALKQGAPIDSIAKSLANPQSRNTLEVAYRLADGSTQDSARLLNFVQTHIEPDPGKAAWYVQQEPQGSYLSDHAFTQLFTNILKQYVE